MEYLDTVTPEYEIINKSNLFDDKYYLKKNPDILHSNLDPLKHFMKYGWKENRNPSSRFNILYYLNKYPDIKKSGMNPLLHYLKYGIHEKRLKNQREEFIQHTVVEIKKWFYYFVLLRTISFFPPFLSYRIACLIGDIQYLQKSLYKNTIENGLRTLFPLNDCLRFSRLHLRLRVKEMLDVFYLQRFKKANFPIEFKGESVLKNAMSYQKGVIIVMAHYGRANMLGLALAIKGYKIGMVTVPFDIRNRSLSFVDRMYFQYKGKEMLNTFGGQWFTTENNDFKKLYRALQNGEIIAIMSDVKSDKSIKGDFFSGKLSVAQGVLRLAEYTHAKIVYGVCFDSNIDNVIAEIRSLPDRPLEAMQSMIKELEKDVQSSPWQWFHLNILNSLWSKK
ncbi:MAG: lysophospholipid acyltransferase family protein [Sulfuricurvum sp.]